MSGAMGDEARVKAVLIDMMRVFTERLPKTKWFAHYGTALAAVFGGHIIPGDGDIDIGILAETCLPEELVKAFDEAGWQRGYFFHDKVVPSRGVVIRYVKDSIPIDFYWFYLRESRIDGISQVIRRRWWLTAPRVPHVLPAYIFDDLRTARLLGLEIPAPYPLEVFADWMWKKHEGSYPAADKPGEPGEMLSIYPEWAIYKD